MIKFIFIIILSCLHTTCFSQAPDLVHTFSVSDDITRISSQIKPSLLTTSEASRIITKTNLSCFNASCGALPVQFLSFDAERISNNEVKVFWKTTNEVNNKSFIVERSLGSTTAFRDEGRVDADNFQAAIHEYTFRDDNDYENISYYRLRQIDHDDKFMLSRIVAVKGYLIEESISVFPNPANKFTSLNIHLKNTHKGVVRLFNNKGQKVHEQTGLFNRGNNTIVLDLGKLVKGLYVIKVYKSDGQTLTTKLLRN